MTNLWQSVWREQPTLPTARLRGRLATRESPPRSRVARLTFGVRHSGEEVCSETQAAVWKSTASRPAACDWAAAVQPKSAVTGETVRPSPLKVKHVVFCRPGASNMKVSDKIFVFMTVWKTMQKKKGKYWKWNYFFFRRKRETWSTLTLVLLNSTA